jgi:hypothetical protein
VSSHHLLFVSGKRQFLLEYRFATHNSTTYLHSLSGVNGVFAWLALKVFEDTKADVVCLHSRQRLLLLIDLLPAFFSHYSFIFL